jgi:SAM-dependent methyltransferase
LARPVRFGDLGGVEPHSRAFGYDRGTPIDRYYIEAFLERHRSDVRGRVLEVGDDSYTARFGAGRTECHDVLHVHAGNPAATIVGDLSAPGLLPQDAFDCMILTQVLHLIYDMPAAVREIHRGLKPGGVALVTVPAISQIAEDEWGENWFWAVTPQGARRLFEDAFGREAAEVEAFGNVFAATCFLQGLALEEIDRRKLELADPAYPLTVTIRARKFG